MERTQKVKDFTPIDVQRSITLATRLKELRERRGLSHERLADELDMQFVGVSKSSLMNYEVTDKNHPKFGKNLGMSVQLLPSIAEFYNVSVDWLLGLTDDPHVKPLAADQLPLSPSNLDWLYKMGNHPESNGYGLWASVINDLIEFGLNASVLVNFLNLSESEALAKKEPKENTKDFVERYVEEMSNEMTVKDMGFYPLPHKEAADYFRSQIAFQFQSFLKSKFTEPKED